VRRPRLLEELPHEYLVDLVRYRLHASTTAHAFLTLQDSDTRPPQPD